MALIANSIDFVMDMCFPDKSTVGAGVDRSGLQTTIVLCYATFAFFWFYIWGACSSVDFSAILTGASCVQCLGFVILSVKVRGTKSVAGLSSKTLEMYVLHFITRLSATTIKNGYIPVDASGDYMYQLLDVFSLLLVIHLLYCVHKTYSYSYQQEHDTLAIMPMVVPCVLLACCIHGDFNHSKFFDTIWMVSTNVETFCMVPQLWMLAKMGGKVDGMTGHFVASVVISAVFTFTFWYWIGQELEKRGPNIAAQMIMAMQVIKLFLCADFMYYYAMAWLSGTGIILPHADGEMEM